MKTATSGLKNLFVRFNFLPQQSRCLLLNRSGFSLVGVLIAASVGSVVFLGLVKSQFYLMRSTKKIESKMMALELTKEIISTLEAPAPDCAPPCAWSKSSCTNTLEGFNDVAGTETVKTAILDATYTSQPSASEVYSTSRNYNGVHIKEMKVVADQTGDDRVILKVWFETDEDVLQGKVSPEMARPFDIYAKVNYVAGGTTVESCTAVITSYSTFSGKACGDGEYFKGFDNIGIMECVSLPKCADNEYLSGFDSNGDMICKVSQSEQECSSGQYLSGFDSDGNKICLNLPISVTGQSCSSGRYLAGFNSSGNTICRNLPSPSPPITTPPTPPHCQYGWSSVCQRCKTQCSSQNSMLIYNQWHDNICGCRIWNPGP